MVGTLLCLFTVCGCLLCVDFVVVVVCSSSLATEGLLDRQGLIYHSPFSDR